MKRLECCQRERKGMNIMLYVVMDKAKELIQQKFKFEDANKLITTNLGNCKLFLENRSNHIVSNNNMVYDDIGIKWRVRPVIGIGRLENV